MAKKKSGMERCNKSKLTISGKESGMERYNKSKLTGSGPALTLDEQRTLGETWEHLDKVFQETELW
jgi:hypothetical protein